MHFVLVAAPPSGLTMLAMVLEAAEAGPLWLRRVVGLEAHMVWSGEELLVGGLGVEERGKGKGVRTLWWLLEWTG
jgi:hypothetical protein